MYAYSYLQDDVIHQIRRAEGDHPDLLKAQNTIEKIMRRQLYAYVGQTYPISNSIVSVFLFYIFFYSQLKRHIVKYAKASVLLFIFFFF